jgi:hypothetical protein
MDGQKKPSWNFSKYLINEEGVLVNYFDPSISPTGKEVMDAIKNKFFTQYLLYEYNDWIGTIGVGLVLLAYFLNTMKWVPEKGNSFYTKCDRWCIELLRRGHRFHALCYT